MEVGTRPAASDPLGASCSPLDVLRDAFGAEALLCASVRVFGSAHAALRCDDTTTTSADESQLQKQQGLSYRRGGVLLTESMLYVVQFDSDDDRGESACTSEEGGGNGGGGGGAGTKGCEVAKHNDQGDNGDVGGVSFDVVAEDVVESITHLVIYVPQEEAAVVTDVDPVFELQTFGSSIVFRLDKSMPDNASVEQVIHCIGALPAVMLQQKDTSEIPPPPPPRPPPPPPSGLRGVSPPSTAVSSLTATPAASMPRDASVPATATDVDGGSSCDDHRDHFAAAQDEAAAMERALRSERRRLREMLTQSLQTSAAELGAAEQEERRGVAEDEAAKRCNIYLVLCASSISLLTRAFHRDLEETRAVLTSSVTETPECIATAEQQAAPSATEGGSSSPRGRMTPQAAGIETAPPAEVLDVIAAHEKAVRLRLGKFLTTSQKQLQQRRREAEHQLAASSFAEAQAVWESAQEELNERVRSLEVQLAHSQEHGRALGVQLEELRAREEAVLERARQREGDLHAHVRRLEEQLQRAQSAPRLDEDEVPPAAAVNGAGAGMRVVNAAGIVPGRAFNFFGA